ncbi:MAG: cytochrome b561 [Granulosicoccus sp.]|jgi:cytochrome b561
MQNQMRFTVGYTMNKKSNNRKSTKSRVLLLALLGMTLASQTAWAAEFSAPTPEGMLPHFESWIALTIVVFAFGTAWLLNHQTPKLRATGTLLAALGCFSVVCWFVGVHGSGVLETPKPFQAPMDALKPGILWLQAIVALLGGLTLVGVANRQRRSTEILELPNANESNRYGRTSRILHWATAILFILMVPMGVFASMIPENVWYRTEYNSVHKTIGFIVLGLLVARLLWNRKSSRPALDPSLKPREKKLAHWAHVALYLLMFAVPVTGYVMTSLHGYPSFFFFIELQPFLTESKAYVVWGLFHKYILQYLIYLILGAHVLGALKHHYIDKHQSAFKRMVS